MQEGILDFLWKGAQVFFLAMLPVIELRGAIPYGLFILKMDPITTTIVAIAGNFVPVYFIIKLLDPATRWIFEKSSWCKHYIEKYFQKLHHQHSKRFNEAGYIGLAAFVAIPFPGTGGWTGAVLAYLFNLPRRQSLIAIFIGIIGAALLMTLFSDSLAWLYTSLFKP